MTIWVCCTVQNTFNILKSTSDEKMVWWFLRTLVIFLPTYFYRESTKLWVTYKTYGYTQYLILSVLKQDNYFSVIHVHSFGDLCFDYRQWATEEMPKSQAICDCYLACNAFQTGAWGKIGPIFMLLFFLFIAFDAIRVLSFKMLCYFRKDDQNQPWSLSVK